MEKFLAVSQKMVDAFFLEIPKEWPEKRLSYGFSQGENWRKRLSFHRAVEMKQPHAMTEPFQKDGQQAAQPCHPPTKNT